MTDNPVLLSFGSNLGDAERIFNTALRALMRNGFILNARSSAYHSKAFGCEPDAPDFRNISVLGIWNGTPEKLLNLVQRLEIEAGRPADHPHWVSRTLDIDILLMGGLRLETERLRLPHPEMLKRDFVLIPSNEIASGMKIPGTNRLLGDFTNDIVTAAH